MNGGDSSPSRRVSVEVGPSPSRPEHPRGIGARLHGLAPGLVPSHRVEHHATVAADRRAGPPVLSLGLWSDPGPVPEGPGGSGPRRSRLPGRQANAPGEAGTLLPSPLLRSPLPKKLSSRVRRSRSTPGTDRSAHGRGCPGIAAIAGAIPMNVSFRGTPVRRVPRNPPGLRIPRRPTRMELLGMTTVRRRSPKLLHQQGA